MESRRRKLVAALASYWFLSITFILLSVAIAVSLYRYKFGSVLSGISSEWSNFGSYMGGIFGPLVSFMTLLAVLKTVYLQRELLDAQKQEFKELNELQIKTFEKQEEQIKFARNEAVSVRVQSYLNVQLNMLGALIDQYRRVEDSASAAIVTMASISGESEEKKSAINDTRLKKEVAEQKIADLIVLSLELSVVDHESIEDIRKALFPQFAKIMGMDLKQEVDSAG